MLDSETARRITDAVDAAFDRQLEFTAELVRHPSLRAAEASAQDFMFAELESRGLAMDRWTLDGEACATHVGYGPSTVAFEDLTNVVGTYTPGGGDRAGR